MHPTGRRVVYIVNPGMDLLCVFDEASVRQCLPVPIFERAELAALDDVPGNIRDIRHLGEVGDTYQAVELQAQERCSDNRVPRANGAYEAVDQAVGTSHRGRKEQVGLVKLSC